MKRFVIAAFAAFCCAHAAEAQISVVPDAIGGVVTSGAGPEAGVWVIAETDSLPTKLVKIVVTDDQGRYVLPQLPAAKYKIWVRGYGLVDSTPVESGPGKRLDLKAALAPSARDAAQYYPANYWYALLQPPPADQFPGTGASGNGIAPIVKTRQEWLANMKENCLFCHQLGDKATREMPPTGSSSVEAWAARIQMARAPGDVTVGNYAKDFAGMMQNSMAHFGRERGLKMFADWTDRIAAGEIPPQAPPRPSGVERNVVITEYDWAGGNFVHDEIATDKRNPTINANGPIYGTDDLNGHLVLFDPASMKPSEVDIPGLDTSHNVEAGVHNPMIDQKNRVWMSDIRGEGKNPDFCTDAAKSPFAAFYPTEAHVGREIALYDPATKAVTMIPTCFGTHHLEFAWDKDNTLYFSGDASVMGWMNTRVWDDTHDPAKAEGWCPMVLDTSGDGKIDPNRANWIEPAAQGAAGEGVLEGGQDAKAGKATAGGKTAAAKDTRITGFLYAMGISPKDQSVWFAKYSPAVPSGLIRFVRGDHPPESCRTEYYEPPKLPDGNYAAFNMRGVDLDSNGIAWVAFGSGQLGRFDRAKCKVTNGPAATGQQCPEGWTFYDSPGPKVSGTKIGAADWHYMTWVDQQNVLGLGKDVPILPGTMSDSLVALEPATGKQLVLRVPYPMNFYTRGLDGRVDDQAAGWKGRGLWADYGGVPLWHTEGGEGTFGKIVKFQLRPDPLAE
jgi:hypothetical protein